MPYDATPCRPAGADGRERSAILFSTDGLMPSARLDAWNACFRSLNDITVAPANRAAIAARNENWRLGPMLLSASSASPSVFRRSVQQARRDGHDHWAIRVLRHGENRLRIGDSCHLVGPGEPVLFSLDQPWESAWSDASWVTLCIPRHAYPEISAGLATLPLGPLAVPAASFLADYVVTLERHVRTGPPAAAPAMAEAARAVVAACLLGASHPRAVSPAQIALAQLERVRELIRRNLASSRLDPERLARLAGMSRSALYRLFAPHGGVARYVQTERLRLVHALLADPARAHVRIVTLAEQAGFFDPSSFSRAFRAAFGYSPREARAAVLAGRALACPAPADDGAGDAGDFGALLRHIAIAPPGRFSVGAAPAPAP